MIPNYSTRSLIVIGYVTSAHTTDLSAQLELFTYTYSCRKHKAVKGLTHRLLFYDDYRIFQFQLKVHVDLFENQHAIWMEVFSWLFFKYLIDYLPSIFGWTYIEYIICDFEKVFVVTYVTVYIKNRYLHFQNQFQYVRKSHYFRLSHISFSLQRL